MFTLATVWQAVCTCSCPISMRLPLITRYTNERSYVTGVSEDSVHARYTERLVAPPRCVSESAAGSFSHGVWKLPAESEANTAVADG